jgi:hypothetical protein
MRPSLVAATAMCLGAGVWACAEPPTAVQDVAAQSVMGPVAASVTGSGHFALPADGVWRTFSFAALEGADGSVSGTFHLRTHVAGGGAKVSGGVDCFSIVGNEVWLAGTIEKAVNPDIVGIAVGWRVVDNGEGSGAAPDQVSRQWRRVDAAGYCEEKPVDQPLFDVEAGNIQIHR